MKSISKVSTVLLQVTLIVSALVFSIALKAQPPSRPDVSEITRKGVDISYASSSKAQKLDIYLPEEGDGPFPVILAIHGGAYKAGDKADGQLVQLPGLKRGYAVISVNYRLSGEAIFHAQINDLKAAVRWVRVHAKEYSLNADLIAS